VGAYLAAFRTLGMVASIRPRGRVLIVDDDPAVSLLITTALEEHGYSTVAAADGGEALRLVKHEVPDVALLDVRLPDVSGYQLCRRLREDLGDSIGIMMVSGEAKESYDRAAGMLLDADDYVIKPFALDELLARVQRLVRRSRPLARSQAAGLTPRELEVLRLMTGGLDHVAIAHDLVIAPKTVAKHIEHILSKLGVHSRAQAVAIALQEDAAPRPVLADVTRLEDVKRRGAMSG
jgi:DNA-binding NarL/FixJ family response regulator